MLHRHSRPHRLQRLIRHDPPTLRSQRVSRRLLRDRILRHLLILRERLIAVEVLIDNAAHAALAMIAGCLAAVVPEGLGVLDGELEHVGRLALLGGEVEAGEDAGAAGERLARLVERRLHHGVVLGQEVELDEVADFGDDVLRLEVQTAVLDGAAGEDAVDDARGADGGGCGGGEAEEEGCRGGEGSVGDHFD